MNARQTELLARLKRARASEPKQETQIIIAPAVPQTLPADTDLRIPEWCIEDEFSEYF